MTALYIILGIIVFFVLLLSIRVNISGDYTDDFFLSVSWLFLKFNIFPWKKKEKAKKEPKKKKTEEAAPEDKKEVKKKDNIFLTFYKNKGFDGVIELINNAASALGRMLNSFRKHIVLREFFLNMTVSVNGDAAATAIQYGRVCQSVFPALSFICSTLPVKKYNAIVEPDYLGTANSAEFSFKISIRPIFFTNALVVFAFRLIFKVGIKFLKGIKNNKNKISDKGGAIDER